MTVTHPYAALEAILAFLLFAVAVAVYYGWLAADSVGGFGVSGWVFFGVLASIGACGTYAIEDRR